METASASLNWGEIKNSIEPLLPLTLDQLRTYVAVCQDRSPRRGAFSIKRDQSSVEKQLKTLEGHFERITNERLISRPSQRGGEIHLTKAGERVRHLAEEILVMVSGAVGDLRKQQQDRTIRIALTTFMISLLTEIQPSILDKFSLAGMKLSRELIHVRSHELQDILLRDRDVDFCLGGLMAKANEAAPIDEGLEFTEWRRGGMVLLSNYDLKRRALELNDLTKYRIPLVLPKTGVIDDFVKRSIEEPDKLNVVEWCNDVHFGVDLLRLNVHKSCMLCTEHIATHAKALPQGERLRYYQLEGSDIQLRVGLFRRKGEREDYAASHPLRMFWDVFEELAARKRLEGLHPPLDSEA